MDSNPLMDLFSRFMPNRPQEDPHYEAIAPLTEKDNKEWEKLISDFEKEKSKILEIEAKKKLFWIKLERKLGIYDRGLRIEGGIVMAEVAPKNNCQTPGERQGIPGFCDGDCNNCAIKPETEEDDEL